MIDLLQSLAIVALGIGSIYNGLTLHQINRRLDARVHPAVEPPR